MDEYLKKFGLTPEDIGLTALCQTTEKPNHSKPHHSPQESPFSNNGKNKFNNTPLKDLPLTMAYVPFQEWKGTYEPAEALQSGTLFPNLDKPFIGRKV